MNERINDKIEEIEEYLSELEELVPSDLEEYKSNKTTKAACERYVEKIIEGVVDLAFLAAKHLKIEIPEQTTDKDIFELLVKNNIISQELSKKLQEAKGMRNILAHEYGKIDDEIVFNSLKNELPDDTKDFTKSIKEHIN